MRLLLATTIAVLSLGSAQAATLCVNPAGSSGCFASVKDAVDSASNGDVILIAAGTYDIGDQAPDHLSIARGARLELIGEGSASTILDGRIEMHFHGAQLIVRGVTIENSSTGVNIHGAGQIVLVDSVLQGHEEALRCAEARVVMDRTTVRGNGSGLFIQGRCNVTISNSTIEGNASRGIFNGERSKLLAENVTISGNGTGLFGGGKSTLINATITSNSSGLVSFSSKTKLANSIVAGNLDGDCSGMLRSAGFNIIGDPTGCDIKGGRFDQSNVDPQLETLQNNGGPTATHALLAGSPAIDAGDPRPGGRGTRCRRTDQRGAARVGVCDIGAFESPG